MREYIPKLHPLFHDKLELSKFFGDVFDEFEIDDKETIISREDLAPTSSVLDIVEEKTGDTPEIPENNN